MPVTIASPPASAGLNRQLFLPFIDLLQRECEVLPLASALDYRQRAAESLIPGLFTVPHDAVAETHLSALLLRMAAEPTDAEGDACAEGGDEGAEGQGERAPTHAVTVPVMMNRTLTVPRACGGAALFTFGEICGRAIGAADYMALCVAFHTIIISGTNQVHDF